MQELVNQVLTAIISSLMVASGVNVSDDREPAPATPIEWSCADTYWIDEPHFDNRDGLYKGVLGADCQFVGQKGGGFPMLDAYLLDRATKSPEVKKVHAGPISEVFAGMPSIYYDITMETKQGNDTLTLRNDNHLATDKKTRYVTSTLSKSAKGTGYAEMLKKIGTEADLKPGNPAKPNHYTMKIKALFHLEKPWYIPGGVFDSKFREEVKKRANKIEEQLINEIATNI